MLSSLSRVTFDVLDRIHTGTTAMHPLPYITVGIPRLDFKPPLHIISYRLNPQISLQHTYYASVKHFTTCIRYIIIFVTGCIRYIIICPLYLVPDNKWYNGFTSISLALSPKKIQPIKYNTSPVLHFTADTPTLLSVPSQLPVTPI